MRWAFVACCGRGLDSSLHTPSHPPQVRKSLPLSTLLALSCIIFIIPFDFSYMFSLIFSRKLGMPPAVSLQAFCVSVVVERNLYTRLFSFLVGTRKKFCYLKIAKKIAYLSATEELLVIFFLFFLFFPALLRWQRGFRVWRFLHFT